VWTYGYNADVIGGLFQSNNKNSVSQHGRDLAVRLEREIDNEVSYLWALDTDQIAPLTAVLYQDPIVFVAHSLGGIIVKDVRLSYPIKSICSSTHHAYRRSVDRRHAAAARSSLCSSERRTVGADMPIGERLRPILCGSVFKTPTSVCLRRWKSTARY
jgi:hypothetical protein